MKSIFNNSIRMTEKTLDFLWKRQEIIANNIANQDTPNYKAKLLTFEDSFRSQIEGANRKKGPGTKKVYAQAIERADADIKENDPGSNRLDGNNVSPDAEYAELARTGLQYQYALRAISDEFMRFRSVIKGQ
ncbi:MAG: flagellar basal body rod protein FlgB [Peptostreptococcaceae bacterium]|nr:flagellar basal body rod protein FlgB [Peptostreptococcaceae bacterium]